MRLSPPVACSGNMTVVPRDPSDWYRFAVDAEDIVAVGLQTHHSSLLDNHIARLSLFRPDGTLAAVEAEPQCSLLNSCTFRLLAVAGETGEWRLALEPRVPHAHIPFAQAYELVVVAN